jgi:uncharacterized membrane protein YcaP (DUF421 family)
MMKEFEIKFWDIERILIGEVPLHFYLEVIFRVAFIYLLLMVSMRFMGKRMSSQLSRNEMAAVASLAAAIGVPLMNPDRGLLPAVVIALVIITLQKSIAKMASKNRKFESLTQDHIDTLIEDGVMKLDVMSHTRITRGRVLAQLRAEQVSHMGMVKRLYFEAGGKFSFLKNVRPSPGLSILPEWDGELSEEIHELTNEKVCAYCGNRPPSGAGFADLRCGNCKKSKWVNAVVQIGSV